jgi:hypothetical protein
MILCSRRERVKMTEQEQNNGNQDVKRWTAKRKAALVLDLSRGITAVAQASRTYDLTHPCGDRGMA